MDPRPFELELGIHRVAETYRIELSHSDPDSQGKTPTLRSTAAIDPDALLPLHGQHAAYGRALAGQLFSQDDVLQRFLQVEKASQAAGRFLRLSLAIDPSAQELQALRWELLAHPETGATLSTSERLLLSRFMVSRDWRPIDLRARTDLVAVVAVSAPHGPRFDRTELATVDVHGEFARARAAMPDIELRFLGGPDAPLTAPALFDAIRDGVDIVYLVSHGTFRRSTGAPVLFLQSEDGDIAPVDGEGMELQLSQLQASPRLVVLASCESAGDGQHVDADQGRTAQATLAGRLADAGIPAIIAMQGKISMATVDAMMPVFFKELLRDGQIDRALAAARSVVASHDDAWMPALYSRLREGKLWYTAGFRVTGGRDSTEVWRRLLQPVRNGKVVPILGPGLLRTVYGTSFELARRRAAEVGFPLASHDWEDLPRVNQFMRVRESRYNVVQAHQQMLLDELLHRHGHWLPAEEQPPKKAPRLGPILGMVADHQRQVDPDDVHALLAGLPASVYVTTNHDPLMERALKAAGRQPLQVVTRWRHEKASAPNQPIPEPTQAAPTVYHAFGAFGKDTDDTLVLTEDDTLDYLIGTTSDRLVPSVVESALVDNSLLFLGFRLTDWSFRVLFRLMMSLPGRDRLKQYCHVAVQLDPDMREMQDVEGAKAYLARYFGQEANIDIFWGSPSEFLCSLHKELANTTATDLTADDDDDDDWDF